MFFFLMIRRPPRSPPFPYATLFRSHDPPRQGNELAEGQKSTDVMHLCIKPPPLRQLSWLAEGGWLDAKMHDIRALLAFRQFVALAGWVVGSEERRVGKRGRSRWAPDH